VKVREGRECLEGIEQEGEDRTRRFVSSFSPKGEKQGAREER